MSEPENEKLNWSQVKKRRCAQCYGPMTMKHVDDEWVIVCPKGCEPGGHVSESFVEQQRLKDSMDTFKVGQNYPELDPNKLTEEELKAGRDALWD